MRSYSGVSATAARLAYNVDNFSPSSVQNTRDFRLSSTSKGLKTLCDLHSLRYTAGEFGI